MLISLKLKKLFRNNNISKCEQVEEIFKSSTYLAWNNNLISNTSESSPSITTLNSRNTTKRRRKIYRFRDNHTTGDDQVSSDSNIDQTLVPSMVEKNLNNVIDFESILPN